MTINITLDTARRILATATPEAKANLFGSIGELDHTLKMAEKWGGKWVDVLAAVLERIAVQRGIDAGNVFVWDELTLTHKLDSAALRRTCDALVAS